MRRLLSWACPTLKSRLLLLLLLLRLAIELESECVDLLLAQLLVGKTDRQLLLQLLQMYRHPTRRKPRLTACILRRGLSLILPLPRSVRWRCRRHHARPCSLLLLLCILLRCVLRSRPAWSSLWTLVVLRRCHLSHLAQPHSRLTQCAILPLLLRLLLLLLWRRHLLWLRLRSRRLRRNLTGHGNPVDAQTLRRRR